MLEPRFNPWTREELDKMKSLAVGLIKEHTEEEAAAGNDIRPLPPMTVEEASDYILSLVEVGQTRLLTRAECFMHGQLLAVFKQAVQAEMLGKKGRYMVISEEQMSQYQQASTHHEKN